MKIPAYAASHALPLLNEEYVVFLRHSIYRARKQVLASVFLADARLTNDPQQAVRSVISELEYAVWKKLDVRIMLGVSRNSPGYLASLSSGYYISDCEIPVRIYRPEGTDGLHSKFVIIDGERLIVGSHNWTHNSFFNNQEISLAITSIDAAAHLANEFDILWARAEELEADAN